MVGIHLAPAEFGLRSPRVGTGRMILAVPDDEGQKQRIDEERARIARLEGELRDARRRLDGLESASASPAESLDRSRIRVRPPESPEAKVALFRSLFQGRTDVFPTLWTNRRTGRKGYAPACSNEWVRGPCDKPRVKCGECTNQAFLSITDEAILGHLQGRHVMGVYPLLQDETCWFVAADFDKQGWAEDVTAFRETCVTLGVPVAVERSRSGVGAHAWLFFAGPVSASDARKLACFLLTETMSRRHELSMSSYDRLFPNQDTMPKGGFGNLIALPLMKSASFRLLRDQARPPWGPR